MIFVNNTRILHAHLHLVQTLQVDLPPESETSSSRHLQVPGRGTNVAAEDPAPAYQAEELPPPTYEEALRMHAEDT